MSSCPTRRRGAHTQPLGIAEPPADPARARQAARSICADTAGGFRLKGNRIGMGAGFYDRTFSFLKETTRSESSLIGYAYDARSDAIDPQAWIIPGRRATEQQFYPFSRA